MSRYEVIDSYPTRLVCRRQVTTTQSFSYCDRGDACSHSGNDTAEPGAHTLKTFRNAVDDPPCDPS